jgi:hypothetical protein
MNKENIPDEASHETGWEARKIDGKWRVGMRGNLDTPHDAVITVHQHHATDEEAQRIAEWTAAAYNTALGL